MNCENTIVLSDNPTLSQIIKTIKRKIYEGSQNSDIKALAAQFLKTSDPKKTAFDYAYEKVKYYPDPEMRQIVKSVHCILKAQKGNCVDYVVLIGSLLLAMSIPFDIKAVSFEGKDMQHVYLVAKDGTVLDPVIGQAQDGTESERRTQLQGQYNKEVKHLHSNTFAMPTLEILQGIRDVKENRETRIIPRMKLRRHYANSQIQGFRIPLVDSAISTMRDAANTAQRTVSNAVNQTASSVSSNINYGANKLLDNTYRQLDFTDPNSAFSKYTLLGNLFQEVTTGKSFLGTNPIFKGLQKTTEQLSKSLLGTNAYGQPKKKLPNWLLPVGLGAGALILLID